MTDATVNDTAERVRAGAALLDARRAGWVDEIDLDALDLAEEHSCVLGQVYGNYSTGLLRVIDWHDFGQVVRDSADHGFLARMELLDEDGNLDEAADAAMNEEYVALTEAWRALITERRASHAQ